MASVSFSITTGAIPSTITLTATLGSTPIVGGAITFSTATNFTQTINVGIVTAHVPSAGTYTYNLSYGATLSPVIGVAEYSFVVYEL
jgi:polyisoprenoid-binding protein YceI